MGQLTDDVLDYGTYFYPFQSKIFDGIIITIHLQIHNESGEVFNPLLLQRVISYPIVGTFSARSTIELKIFGQ